MPAEAPRHVLPTLVLAQLAGTSPWFAANAVMPDLQRAYGWDAAAVGTLTSSLQFGFIAGTLVFALLAVADRWPARRVFLLCALAAAGCTLAAALGAQTYGAWLGWRALTGFCLAGIYPVGMKIASQWFPQGLGRALGWLVGALVIGSASPHALRALGAGWDWRTVLMVVAGLSVAAGVAVIALLPEPPRPAGVAVLRFGALASLWRDAKVRASAGGYFGHMVELYTVWVLMPAVLATRLADAVSVSWGAFAALGAGGAGCVIGGLLVRRWGGARVAATMLACSGLCCLAAPWMLAAPLPLFIGWLVAWGFTAAGDSPQFSALTAQNAPRAAVGSVLTLVNSIGFAISIASIELFVHLAHTHALGAVLPWLALGPLAGLWMLRPLLQRPPMPA